MTKTLEQRAVRSGRWVILGHLFSQALRLGSNLVLTRLLVPEMFGVMSVVTAVMFGLAMFSDVGLLQNIVQSKRGEDLKYLNTAWTIQILRGFLIFFIALLLSAGLYFLGQGGYLSIDTVYGNPELPLILAVVSIRSIISGFGSIQMLLLNRKLMLGKLTVIELTSQLAGLVFMLIWAWFQRDIWALIYGGFATAIVKLILSHSMNLGERCKFHWDTQAAYEIIHFGKWIFVSSILGFLLSQGDRLLLSLWVSSEMMGIYSIAFFLAMALKDVLKKMVSSVFYPMLSEVARDDPSQLKETYYKIRAKVDVITMLVAGLMASMGQPVIELLYDERYRDAGWMLELLSWSIVFVGYSMAGVCLMALGNVKSSTWLMFVATAFLYISLPVAYYFFGLYGAIVMISLNYIIDIPSTFYMLRKNKLLNIRKEFRMLPILMISYYLGLYLLEFMKEREILL